MSKHTSGNLIPVGLEGNQELRLYSEEHRFYVAREIKGVEPEEATANAYLFAAAPDLLLSLKWAVEEMHKINTCGSHCHSECPCCVAISAIKKAEGRA